MLLIYVIGRLSAAFLSYWRISMSRETLANLIAEAREEGRRAGKEEAERAVLEGLKTVEDEKNTILAEKTAAEGGGSALSGRVDGLKKELEDEKSSNNSNTKSLIEGKGELNAKLLSTGKELNGAEQREAQAEKKVGSLQKSLDHERQTNEKKIEHQVSKIKNQAQEIVNQRNSYKDEKDGRQKDKEDADNKLVEEQTRHQMVEKELQQEAESASAKVERIEQEKLRRLLQSEKAHTLLLERIFQLESEKAEQSKAVMAAKDETSSMKQKYEQLQRSCKDEAKKHKTENERVAFLEQQNDDLNRTVQAQQSQLDGQTALLDSYNTIREERNASVTERTQLRSDNDTLRNSITTMQNANGVLQGANTDLETELRNAQVNAQTDIAESQSEQESLKEKLRQTEQELQAHNDTTAKKKSLTELALQDTEEELTQANDTIENLRAELKDALQQIPGDEMNESASANAEDNEASSKVDTDSTSESTLIADTASEPICISTSATSSGDNAGDANEEPPGTRVETNSFEPSVLSNIPPPSDHRNDTAEPSTESMAASTDAAEPERKLTLRERGLKWTNAEREPISIVKQRSSLLQRRRRRSQDPGQCETGMFQHLLHRPRMALSLQKQMTWSTAVGGLSKVKLEVEAIDRKGGTLGEGFLCWLDIRRTREDRLRDYCSAMTKCTPGLRRCIEGRGAVKGP